MTLRTPLASLALALLVFANAAAQLPQLSQDSKLPQLSQESKEEKEKAQKELERRALSLLDDTLQSAQALKLAENRAVVRAQAADLLWKRDEKRARSLFRDAVSDLAAALGGDTVKRDRSYWMLVQLRPQLLQMVAARDPQLALDLLRESRPAPGENAETVSGMGDQELRMEQSIMAQAAENDPKAALKMAEESLDKGVTYGVLSVIERLRQKDAEAATRLAGEVVEKLQGENLTSDREATLVAVNLLSSVLLPPTEQSFRGAAFSNRDVEKPKPLVMEDDAVRDLADLVSSAALKDTSGMYGLLMQVRPLMPELEKRVPARAAQLRAKIEAAYKTLDPQTRAWTQFESLMSQGSADAILDAAAKAPPEMRQNFYSMAAMKLAQSGDTERVRQVINDNLSGQAREQMLAQVDGLAVSRAVEKGNLDEARAVVSRIKSKERRAGALAQLATAFAARGDRKGAAQLLDEARGLVSRQPDNEKEMAALLEVARGYALVEPSKTFEMIDPLIDQANDMLAAAALLEKFGAGQGLFRKGEMILSPGFSNINGMYGRYVKALAELARVDFDRTRSDADRFHHEEVRLMARLVIAQSILSDHLDAGGGVYGFGEGYTYGGGSAILVGY
ncbi:MAG: hypothetical protein DMF67_15995 [Acidobacteria bacterium]|nr:MAG: hypothetical protein DMF67_15995 [Acidobacteriota bacterium]